jgi:hypothetical protein
MSTQKNYTSNRTYRFPQCLAVKLKNIAYSQKITESDLVRSILETGLNLMLIDPNE